MIKVGYSVLLVVVCLSVTAATAQAASHVAASSSQVDVQNAINAAVDGDTVNVPAGISTWSGFSISKGIHLKGAGSELTDITVSGSISLTKNSNHPFELSGFSFSKSGGGNETSMFNVDGAWSDKPQLIHHNIFTVSNAGMFKYRTNGGVLHHNTFNGNWNDSGIQHYITQDTKSWTTADSMGDRDTNGALNLYIEDNIFNGMVNQGTDFGDASRVVFRYNKLTNSSFNTHGLSTSPQGVRHYEIYNNQFLYPDNTVNQNWQIWLRGGTGVIYDNQVDDLNGQMWGNKTELLLSVRAADQPGVNDCATSYPAEHQVGQNHNGTTQFLDAIRVWGNTGTLEWSTHRFADECDQDINDYIQEGRDIVFAPKPGYMPYPYPHPLAVGPADFDGDGDVDDNDLSSWRTGFGASSGATRIDGDADKDGDVDGADFLIWQHNFDGAGTGSVAVPEPASCILVGILILARSTWRGCSGITAIGDRRSY